VVLPVAAGAKPPDLPIDQSYYVTPQVPNDLADWVMPLVPSPVEWVARHCVGAIMTPDDSQAPVNGVIQVHDDSHAPVNLPWLFRLSPTPRRQLASYLLLVAHPLLLLTPTEKLLDTPADHPYPANPLEVLTPPCGSAPSGQGPVTVILNEKNFDICRDGQCPVPVQNAVPEPFAPVGPPLVNVEVGCVEKPCRDSARRIEQCLGRTVTLSFSNTPLKKVIEDLRDGHGINIYADVRAFEESGINFDGLMVNVKLDQVSLRSALDLILRPCGLTFVVRDDVLQITTPAYARGRPQMKLYAVKDLLQRARPEAADDLPAPEDQLIKLIALTIAPESWREMGGQGVIEYFPATKTLVISQTAEVQEQVVELLASLRRLKVKWAEEQRQADADRAAARVEGLLKACRILIETGNHEQADKLACDAFALDADKVLDDPMVSQIYLKVRQQSKYQGRPAEKCGEPCGLCPAGYGRKECEQPTPILEVLQPSMLPVGHKVVKPLEVVEEESELTRCARPSRPVAEAKPFRAAGTGVFDLTAAKDRPRDEDGSYFSLFNDLLEMCMPVPAGHGCIEIGLGTTGPALCGQVRLNGTTFHMIYRDGGLAVWTTRYGGLGEDDK
jgi:hypothetical protein